MSYRTDKIWLLEHKYKGHVSEAFEVDCERLRLGEPLDYIVGYSDFLDTKISLAKNPLIPRTETEFWLNTVIENIDKRTKLGVLDIFSGSGCIGVSILKNLPEVSVTFAEIRADLISTIEESIALNNLNERDYKVLVSDVFENVTGKFNYIFANPPYIDKARNTAEKSVLEFEPHDALFAEDNGLQYIKQLILEAPEYLSKSGILYIEFDSWQKDLVESYCNSNAKDYMKIEFMSDQYSIPRVAKLTLKD